MLQEANKHFFGRLPRVDQPVSGLNATELELQFNWNPLNPQFELMTFAYSVVHICAKSYVLSV